VSHMLDKLTLLDGTDYSTRSAVFSLFKLVSFALNHRDPIRCSYSVI